MTGLENINKIEKTVFFYYDENIEQENSQSGIPPERNERKHKCKSLHRKQTGVEKWK